MAGAAFTAGSNQRLYVKLESADDALRTSVAWSDFVGAGKIVDPTSDTTYGTDYVEVVGDVTLGGDANVDNWVPWGRSTGRSLVTGQTLDNIEFTIKMDRTDTTATALENVSTGVKCWGVVLRANDATRTGVTADATVDPFFGSISVKKNFRGDTASDLDVTIAPDQISAAIDES